jgi:arylsulfatase A
MAGDAKIEAVTRPTPIRMVPSPDRVPREEVYEMEWHELPVGKVTLEAGPALLVVDALTKPGFEVMQLKAVRLQRLSE